ncbi:MAG: TerB family tellurite resistance protein [Lachnospiraceae bacterium]|nr:TerB family tellurite resistance protein [Lachnospiraceae bacterium]
MYIKKRDAVKFYYYLIAADGEVKQSELEKFEEIGKETDTSFGDYRDEVIKECKQQLKKVIDEDEYYEVIKEGIDEALGEENDFYRNYSSYDRIGASLVLWNLLSIAVSDKEYAAEEQKLIRYMVRKLEIDKVVYLEMENAIKTIQNIDRTIMLLSNQDKGFVIKDNNLEIDSSIIGETVKEYTQRRDVIFNSIKELIAD